MKTEAAIIGGGPAGLIAARELARLGLETTLFEEHYHIGEPNHCAGILSVEGLQRLGVEPNSDFIQHEVRGGTVYSPSGTPLRITDNRTRAYIVDRAAFDKHLSELASNHGAVIETGVRVTGLLSSGGVVHGVKTKDDIPAQVVINSEGISGKLAGSLGFPKPKGVKSGINAEVSGIDVEPGMVEIWFGCRRSPGFFVWVAPTGDNSARVGLGCNSGDPWTRLKDFLNERFEIYQMGEPKRWPIITGGPLDVTHCGGMLLVGDVAGQVKPTTAGGVILGGLCALEAANVASKVVERGDSSMRLLKDYDEAWKRKLGKEFGTMLQARRVVDKLSDARIDRLFEAAKEAGLEEMASSLIREGDMDMQSKVIRKALINPSVIKVGISVLGRTLFSEFSALLKT